METVNFEQLEISEPILRAVTEMGFEEASPIQAKAIPAQMEGLDIIGLGKRKILPDKSAAAAPDF